MALIIPFDKSDRTQKQQKTAQFNDAIKDTYIMGEVEVRPDTWIRIDGIPLDLTVGELSSLSRSVFEAITDYAEENGLIK